LQEVTVTAEHLKRGWAERNELVQKATTFVYGIAAAPNYGDYPPRWYVPICPFLEGVLPEEGKYILERIWTTARATGGAWLGGRTRCQPNLRIYVTSQPKEFLRSSGLLRGAKSYQIERLIDQPGPVWVWHNTYEFRNTAKVVEGSRNSTTGWGFGSVDVVVDRARLSGISQNQIADYIAMVSLTEVKPTPHLGDAQTILRLFDAAAAEAAPQGLSDWDREFLKFLYHPEKSLATPRSLIARRMVFDLVP
jgi:hypothetical protein